MFRGLAGARAFTSAFTRASNKTKLGLAVGGATGVAWFVQNYFANSPVAEEIALNAKEFRELRLDSVQYYNHNSSIFRLAFPDKSQSSGLTTASYILVQGTGQDGKEIARPYTPINSLDSRGYIDLLIKEYPGGNVSKYIHSLKVGQKVKVKGPFVSFDYTPNSRKEIGMIAGGTGITPMVQVIRTIFSNPEDKTKVSLVFANVSEEDILLREYFEDLSSKYPDRFKVYYTLDKPPAGWTQGSGFVTEDLVKRYLPPPSNENLILFCGPPPMLNSVAGPLGPNWTQGEVGGVLKTVGYTSDQVYKF